MRTRCSRRAGACAARGKAALGTALYEAEDVGEEGDGEEEDGDDLQIAFECFEVARLAHRLRGREALRTRGGEPRRRRLTRRRRRRRRRRPVTRAPRLGVP